MPSNSIGRAPRVASAKAAAAPAPTPTPKKAEARAREVDTAAARKAVAAPGVAGFTPLPSLSLGDLVPNARVERQPTRTWSFSNGKATEVALKAHGATLPEATKYKAMSEADLSRAVKAGHAARAKELTGGSRPATAMVMPEDGNVKVRAFHMASLGTDATGFAYPLAMAEVGKAEGFRVVIRVEDDRAPDLKKELKAAGLEGHVTLIPLKVNDPMSNPDDLDFWSEDQGELYVDGSIGVPRSLKKGDGIGETAAWRSVVTDRMKRLHPHTSFAPRTDKEWAAAMQEHKDVAFAAVGAVSYRGGQRAIAALGVGTGKPVRVFNGYLEGGNSLVGRRANGEGYAVVGKDSLAVSRAALEKDLGRKVSDAELKGFIAADFGVPPAGLVAVEQPDDFHIDMHMMLLPGGHAVVNDAMEAFELQKQWLTADLQARQPKPPPPGASKTRLENYQLALDDWKSDQQYLPEQLQSMAARARQHAAFEARVVKDLQAGGLEVHRMAGVFPSTGNGEPMNFLNGEAAKNAQGDGFYVALGGDARAEAYVVQKLAGELPSGLSRVHFLDRQLTGYTLNSQGGLSCRAKLEGDLA